jgi:chaperonin cofactor prefoldin
VAIIVLYASAISDALSSNASDEELETIANHARTVLEQQGDLRSALEKLEAEIARRRGGA